MALLGSIIPSDIGLRVLLCPLGSNVVIRTACCTIGIGLPIYSTFKAIEAKNSVDQEKLLLYWAAYGSFSVVESLSDKVLYWCPFYYHLKFAFLIWLQFPSVEGSRSLYVCQLRPFFLRHQARIDQILSLVSDEMAKFLNTHQKEIMFLKALLGKGAVAANQILKELSGPTSPSYRRHTLARPEPREWAQPDPRAEPDPDD